MDLRAIRKARVGVDFKPPHEARIIPEAGDSVRNDLVVISAIRDAGLIRIRETRLADCVVYNLDVRHGRGRISGSIELRNPDAYIILTDSVLIDLSSDAVRTPEIRAGDQQDPGGGRILRPGVFVVGDLVALDHAGGAETQLNPVAGDKGARPDAIDDVIGNRGVNITIGYDAALLIAGRRVCIDFHSAGRG